MKSCSISLIIKKMQINTKVRYNLTPVRMTIIIKEITSIGEDAEKREQWYTVGESESEVAQSCSTLCDPMDSSLHQAPLPMGFSRQEYWSGLPFPSPGNLPNPGIEPRSLTL